MSASIHARLLALAAAFLIAAAVCVSTMAPAANAGTGPIRFVGHPRTTSTSSAPSSGSAVSDRDELTMIRERMQEDAEFSPAGKSVAITKNLPTAQDLTDGDGVNPLGGLAPSGFPGLTHFDSRYSDGGNQYSGEPADLGMCTDGYYVLELVNNAVQLFLTDGTPMYDGTYGNAGSTAVLTQPVDSRDALSLNQFFGQPTYFDRNLYYDPDWDFDPDTFGPNLFDVSCIYDPDSDFWFATSAKIDVDDTTGDYTERGANSVLLAATQTPQVLASWQIWEIDTTNDGQNGTPDHGCDGGPCFGDYPQLGVNEDGVFITTNEFSFFGAGFSGAQLYAIDKADLVAGVELPGLAHLENIDVIEVDDVAYTLQPANTVDATSDSTMYFGMSLSPYSATVTDRFVVYALDTSELGVNPALVTKADLYETTVDAGTMYGTPQWALQKPGGNTPYLNYLNAGGFGVRYARIKSPIPLDAGSGKFYGAWRDGGYLYFATATAAKGTGGATYSSKNGGWSSIKQRTALALFVVGIPGGIVGDTVEDFGIYGVAGQNLIYPSVAVSNGAGAMGATLVGPSVFPAAAYVRFTFGGGSLSSEAIQQGVGLGPNDGFTGTGDGGYRTRWGDYGAAAVDADGDLWFAAHDVQSGCSTSDYVNSVPFGTCSGTRTTLANWSTRVFQVDL